MSSSPLRRRATAAVAIVAGLASVAACGARSSTESGDDRGGDSSAIVAEAEANLETWYAGTDRELPSSAPSPEPGKNVWVISCAQVSEGCASSASAAKEAGELLDWDVTVFDGKSDVSTWSAGVRQAIADKADGIVLTSIDCGPIKSALDDARAAGVKIYASYGFDCTDDDPSEEARFDATNYYGELGDLKTWLRQYGASIADWVIAKTDGRAKVIMFRHDELKVVKYEVDGFEERLRECETCEIVDEPQITMTDYTGNKLQQRVQTIINQHPEATVIEGMYDTAVLLGIAPAVMASGRSADLLVTGSEGFAANIDLIRNQRGQSMIGGSPNYWLGWVAIDAMNRLFHGEEQVDSGIGWQAADAEHNLPAEGELYDGTVDYQSNYKRIWGVN